MSLRRINIFTNCLSQTDRVSVSAPTIRFFLTERYQIHIIIIIMMMSRRKASVVELWCSQPAYNACCLCELFIAVRCTPWPSVCLSVCELEVFWKMSVYILWVNTQQCCVRDELISRHEDQLTTITQLCKREMSLLIELNNGTTVRTETDLLLCLSHHVG